MPRRLIWALLFVFGVSIPLPIFLIPNQQFSPRLTDLTLVLVLPVAWASIRSLGAARPCLLVAAFAGAAIMLSFAAQSFLSARVPLFSDFVFYGRWILCILAAPAICILFATYEDLFSVFLYGMVTGAGLHAATLVAAELGLRDLLLQFGLASPRSLRYWAGDQERITTLAEHPNQTMDLISLALPSSLSLYLIRRNQRLVLIASIFIVAVGFHFTLSRSSLIAISLVAIIFCFQFARAPLTTRYFIQAAGLAALAVCAMLIYVALGWHLPTDHYVERFDVAKLSENIGGRFASSAIGIAFLGTHPFGIGWSRFLEGGPYLPYGGATHNGFIFAGRTAGLLIGLGLLYGQLRMIVAVLTRRLTVAAAPLYIYVFSLAWSEDIVQGASFTFLACLVATNGILFAIGAYPQGPNLSSRDQQIEASGQRQEAAC